MLSSYDSRYRQRLRHFWRHLALMLTVTAPASAFSLQGRRCPPASYSAVTTIQSNNQCYRPLLASRRQRDTYVDDYWEEEEETEPIRRRRAYYEDEDDDEEDAIGGSRYYDVRFDDDIAVPELDWELGADGSTWVCLPPFEVTKPTAVLHFVGGTFFGSSPKLWYKALLEGLVQTTQCAVVETAIPVTLLKNPLNHVQLARKLQRQFQNAHLEILQDEYGPDVMATVPVVGVGHSLGARLMVVLETLSGSKKTSDTNVPRYKSFVLMSFTNYGASASIPGVQTLLQQRKSLDQTGDEVRRKRTSYLYVDDEDDYLYDDDDEDLKELLEEFQDTVVESAARVRDALTPREESLEFYPAPDQLWKALKHDQRYHVPQTLLVQFDDDQVDQSPRLANALAVNATTDIKFARLHGNHLTPVSITENDNDEDGLLAQIPQRASKAIWKLLRGERRNDKTRQRRKREDSTADLRQSIGRYITDIVTRE